LTAKVAHSPTPVNVAVTCKLKMDPDTVSKSATDPVEVEDNVNVFIPPSKLPLNVCPANRGRFKVQVKLAVN